MHFVLQTNFFLRFKEENPGEKVEEWAFMKLWPFFVRPLKVRNICCYIYHVEAQMLCAALNRMRDGSFGIHNDQTEFCFCDICHPASSIGHDWCCAYQNMFAGLTALCHLCVCLKGEFDMWHKKRCLLGECQDCGVLKKLLFCPSELSPHSAALVKWKRFENVEVGINLDSGDPKFIVQEAYKETLPFELVNFFKPILQKFICHNYIAKWQDTQARLALSSLREGDLLSYLDFAKNYTFQVQDEVQSEYYRSVSVTFSIHITYRVVIDTNTNESTILKEMHSISTMTNFRHDNFFVQHCIGRGCRKWE